jgi:hypothetical protein
MKGKKKREKPELKFRGEFGVQEESSGQADAVDHFGDILRYFRVRKIEECATGISSKLFQVCEIPENIAADRVDCTF